MRTKTLGSLGWAILAVLGIVAFVGIMAFGWYFGTYNTIIRLDESVDTQWAQIEAQYQRRYDLIPNLVNTVKGYMKYEKDVLTEVTALRSQWGEATTPAEKMAASTGLEGAISRLLVVMENYPDLRASTHITGLMDELAGTENRISFERRKFNDNVKGYNIYIKRFPASIVANMNGFTEKDLFEANEGAEVVPNVEVYD